MKTNTIILALYGDAQNVNNVCGRYTSDFDTKQKVTYEVIGELAMITAIEPVIKTAVNLPLPFVVPVNDLGSGLLVRIDLDCNTLRAQTSICPTPAYASRYIAQPGPKLEELFHEIADALGIH